MHSATLEGKFVDLRPLTPDDAAITFEWRQTSRARLLNRGAADVAQQADWIRSRPKNEFNFIIQLKDRRAIGLLALVGVDAVNRHAESGRFLIGEEVLARGVPAAVEAMKLLYEFAFDQLDLVRVFGFIAGENNRMLKWQKYLGMREEGRMRNHYFIDNRFQDAIVMGILADEFRQDALPRMQALIAVTQG